MQKGSGLWMEKAGSPAAGPRVPDCGAASGSYERTGVGRAGRPRTAGKQSGRMRLAHMILAASLLLAAAGCAGTGGPGQARSVTDGGIGSAETSRNGTAGGSGKISAGSAGESAKTSASPGTASGAGDTAAAPVAAVDEQPGTVFYEIFVRSFYDSNGDGIGDLKGVTEKLDYLKDLGVGGIWLMPVTASPSYHGYDTTDYYSINKDYGTLADLKKLTEEAHKRGIKVIMDLVVNHTSKEHPWFKAAAADRKSKYRAWYRFEPADAKVPADGAAGAAPWHPLGSSKYLGIFWEGMPDLNFDEPAVRSEMIKIGQYWLKQGVDGFRLDAAKHIYGDFTSTAGTPDIQQKNRQWWQEFRTGIAEANKNAYLIGEVWDSPVIISPLLDRALDSAFNFELAGKLLSAADREQNPDLGFSLDRIYAMFEKSSGGTFVDAPFLSNHDQTRAMSALNGNVDHAKMAASLLLTLPGDPFIYYGEEIGMKGTKPDERIREPLPWYASPEGGKGQTSWEASLLNPRGGPVSVEAQLADPDSLLSHYKKLIAWRNEIPALRDGGIGDFRSDNPQVAAYVRMTQKERVLVVHNLSGERKSVEVSGSGGSSAAFAEIAKASKDGAALAGGKLTLPPYSTVILK